MTLEELEAVHKRNKAMILSRAGKAGVKAVTFGSESLDALVTDIADAYGLSAADRDRLYPFRSVNAVSAAQTTVSTIATAPIAAEAGRIAKEAHEHHALAATGKALLQGGLDAARTAAKGGAVKAATTAGKRVPWLAVAVGLYGASTAGWFWTRARKYNQACFDLLKARIEGEPAPKAKKKPSGKKNAGKAASA